MTTLLPFLWITRKHLAAEPISESEITCPAATEVA